jgi:hypothetical protein
MKRFGTSRLAWGLMFATGLCVGIGTGLARVSSQNSAAPPQSVRMKLVLPGGRVLHMVEYDGGLATLSLKDGPTLGLTPVVRDLGKRQVRVTVFDLLPGGKPGKVALEDLDLSVNGTASTVVVNPPIEVTVVALQAGKGQRGQVLRKVHWQDLTPPIYGATTFAGPVSSTSAVSTIVVEASAVPVSPGCLPPTAMV